MPDLSNFALVRAESSARTTIERLIQLYLYDMASESPFEIQQNGAYEYTLLDAFWDQAYLLYVGQELAGFALVTSYCPITGKSPCWFMAEFFVLRYHRRRSVGRSAVQAILMRHPGPWHVAVMAHNAGAEAFWSKAIPFEANQQFQVRHDNMDWTIRSFDATEESSVWCC